MSQARALSLRRVLLIAFHFPPFKGSSGLERTLAFCRHLRASGWQPTVLSASPRAYPAVSNERIGDIPADVGVERAFALDTSRHLAIRGAYPSWAALPDRWISWVVGALPAVLRRVRRERPSAIWSTYPIATAHIIGWGLHRLTKLPWIADFRDPMVEYDARKRAWAPANAAVRKARLWIEKRCAEHAAGVVFCTHGALEIFIERHPGFHRERAVVIPNGFDESAFAGLSPMRDDCPPGVVKLLHSGVLYPGPDRDPGAFLRGVRSFLDARPDWSDRLRIVLRATGFDSTYAPVIASLGLERVVELAPPLPYRQALSEMLGADALLVFQGYTSNPAIPAKAYEYLRARRPILALLDSAGDTAKLLRDARVGTILPIEDSDEISRALGAFLEGVTNGTHPVLGEAQAAAYERSIGAQRLAELLSECVDSVAIAAQTPRAAADSADHP